MNLSIRSHHLRSAFVVPLLFCGLCRAQSTTPDLRGIDVYSSNGTHVLTTSYINTIDPATGVREFQAFGPVEFRGNENNSSFQGLQGSLQRSLMVSQRGTPNAHSLRAFDDVAQRDSTLRAFSP